MMGIVACVTPGGDAAVFLLLDRGGLPVAVSGFPPSLYQEALDRHEDEIVFYTRRGPEVYRLVANPPCTLPEDGGEISCVRLLHADLSDVPDLPDLGIVDCPESAPELERPPPSTDKLPRRKPR